MEQNMYKHCLKLSKSLETCAYLIVALYSSTKLIIAIQLHGNK